MNLRTPPTPILCLILLSLINPASQAIRLRKIVATTKNDSIIKVLIIKEYLNFKPNTHRKVNDFSYKKNKNKKTSMEMEMEMEIYASRHLDLFIKNPLLKNTNPAPIVQKVSRPSSNLESKSNKASGSNKNNLTKFLLTFCTLNGSQSLGNTDPIDETFPIFTVSVSSSGVFHRFNSKKFTTFKYKEISKQKYIQLFKCENTGKYAWQEG